MSKIDETRARIIETAAKLFHRFGFEKTSMDDIAKAAHKAKGSLYYHFPSKESLFRTVIEQELDKIKNELLPILEDPNKTAPDKLQEYLTMRMQLLNKAVNLHHALRSELEEQYTNVGTLDFVNDMRSDFDKWEKMHFIALFEYGVKSGKLNHNVSPMVMADMLLMILKSLEVQFFLQDKYDEYRPTFDSMVSVIIYSICNHSENNSETAETK